MTKDYEFCLDGKGIIKAARHCGAPKGSATLRRLYLELDTLCEHMEAYGASWSKGKCGSGVKITLLLPELPHGYFWFGRELSCVLAGRLIDTPLYHAVADEALGYLSLQNLR